MKMKTESKSRSQLFFSPEEQEQIRAAVQKAEGQTSGELVPMLVGESHSYPLAAVRGGSLVALVIALFLTAPVAGMFWLSDSNMWVFIGIFLPVYWLTNLLIGRTPLLKRFFLFTDEMDREVQQAAFASFFEEGLYKTRDANGILIYISLLERRAWIIADSGINDRIEKIKWDEAVHCITNGIKTNQACDALCRAIAMVGDILITEFPIREDDENELHDLILR